MADSSSQFESRRRSSTSSRLLNPWVLNFQKLGLELKCPLCLNLLNRPMLLPCNHVFCKSCIPGSTQFGADCPVCKAHFVDQDLWHLPFMENMATIYRCLEATFSANLFQPVNSDGGRVLLQSPASTNIMFDCKMYKDLPENGQEDNSHSGQSINEYVGVDNNGKVQNCSTPVNVKSCECKMNERGTELRDAVNPNSSSLLRSQVTTVDIDTNAVLQSALDSPPFSNAKGSDNDSYYHCSDHSSENSLVKKPTRENDSSALGKLRNYTSSFETDNNVRELKRQKQLNYELVPLGMGSANHIQPVSHSKLEVQTKSQASLWQSKILHNLSEDKTICAFCHSSKISEHTGPMLHYSSGKLVVGHEATLSNVIHVHKVCIDWAPQVYYIDDMVKNLKQEVARGAKLKCSACGLKGAALGCYVRSCRRSYHVPCAMGISKCRWNYDDFLMLCPAHYSVRFPNEKSKSGKTRIKDHPMPTIVGCQLTNMVASPGRDKDKGKKWVFCGSALSSEEKILLVKFGMMNGATVSKFWNQKVTHLIAATDEKGACTRTLKVLMAILNGTWIVKVDWIKACMEAKCHVDEEPYEVKLDNYGCCDGPQTARLSASSNAPKLFSGLYFYFVGDFLPSYMEDLQELVIAAGGTVLKSREELVAQSCGDQQAVPTPRALVVYNIDPLEGCKLGEEVSILWQRLNEAEDLASETGSKVIGHTWLLDSIAGYKLQSVVS
ncbi:BRCA1-associated [Parasponia andersonii]|uniref:BRCA1-associated n=1 Tax=Parasponia andersonii TaxID=3476 RepID=A0A2P5AE27_PARAD|nr:BRCA1-associated [Parasponia andersonii]